MRKITGVLLTVSLFLFMAFPTAAYWGFPTRSTTNTAIVTNDSQAQALTGGNTQSQSTSTIGNASNASGASAQTAGGNETMSISSGNASAESMAMVAANVNEGCSTCGYMTQKNTAKIGNTSFAGSDTGSNAQAAGTMTQANASNWSHATATNNKGTGSSSISTGGALSKSGTWTVVNAQWH